jgi:colanic acid biosynthesis glycosyl transferase WcaI
MKILILTMHFYPELTGVGRYTGEMASWFSDQGHEVRVISPPPFYPDWKLRVGYSSWWWKKENFNGVLVYRCPIWIPRVPNGLKRFLLSISFGISSLPALFCNIRWRPDIVWAVEPSLVVTPAALFFSSVSGSKSVLHIQDYEIDAAFKLGILRSRALKKIAYDFERYLLRKFSLVSTISNRMIDIAISKGAIKNKLAFFPNWVDLKLFENISTSTIVDFRKLFNISSEDIVALYSGSMGEKQGLNLLSAAARRLIYLHNSPKKLHFIFCGGGLGLSALKISCESLPNVHFLELQPENLLPDLLKSADIHLLPQRSNAEDLVMPSKLTGMLASGRSVLVTANKHTDLALNLDGIALIVEPDNLDAFVSGLLLLYEEPQLREKFAIAGRNYAISYLDKNKILKNYEDALVNIL